MEYTNMTTTSSKDYELLDSGDGEKLERYGVYVLARPDPQALWHKKLPAETWTRAHGKFNAAARATADAWTLLPDVPERWPVTLGSLSLWIHPSNFKHTGIFPEQTRNWHWIEQTVRDAKTARRASVKVLNLFGYTGAASLAAAKGGAEVVHVDGSKVAIKWGKENAELSGLSAAPIRWILDDAVTFVKREATRGNTYDGIIMDPPAFGRGAKGEVWKIEEDFLKLVDFCGKILTPKPLFLLINGYAAGYSATTYRSIISDMLSTHGALGAGTLESGELTIQETGSGRALPAGIYARWQATT